MALQKLAAGTSAHSSSYNEATHCLKFLPICCARCCRTTLVPHQPTKSIVHSYPLPAFLISLIHVTYVVVLVVRPTQLSASVRLEKGKSQDLAVMAEIDSIRETIIRSKRPHFERSIAFYCQAQAILVWRIRH